METDCPAVLINAHNMMIRDKIRAAASNRFSVPYLLWPRNCNVHHMYINKRLQKLPDEGLMLWFI